MNPEPECNLIRRWISLVEDQELSTERIGILESHLDRCSDCRNWKEEFQRGMDALDLGVDEVSGEINELLIGSLDPDKLAPPGEPAEIARAADRAAPRLAALAAGVLILISVFAWGVFSGFRLDTSLFDSDSSNRWGFRAVTELCILEIDGEELLFEQAEEVAMVELGQEIHCRSGRGEIVGRDGRVISLSVGTLIIPSSGSTMTLLDGMARFVIPPGLGGFVVTTDEVTTSVLGTVFEVQRWASRQRSEVRVIEGSVAVVRDEKIPLPLRGGERVEVTRQGLMFHAARIENEGDAPLPRARLGGVVKDGPGTSEATESAGDAKPDTSTERSREGNLPVDLPVNQRQRVDPDGED